jgi:N-acetylneuraminic acid mutarotase
MTWRLLALMLLVGLLGVSVITPIAPAQAQGPGAAACIRHGESWAATSLANAPTARQWHTAVWTGREMLVWGGFTYYGGTSHYLNSGGRYDPATDTWTPMSTVNAPAGRQYHTAVWTGIEMLVWGGWINGDDVAAGGRYNPITDTWLAMGTNGEPAARRNHSAVWTGREMVVWGGGSWITNTGGRYDPATDRWAAMSTSGAPPGRLDHSVVWTGGEMLVWAGDAIGTVNTGGRYNPATDSWTVTSTTGAPLHRAGHTAVWTGREMVVWGGEG